MKTFPAPALAATLPALLAIAVQAAEPSGSAAQWQDLGEVRAEAARFIAGENQATGAHWQVGDPNPKVLVPGCVVPLKATWLPESRGRSGHNVRVHCSQGVAAQETGGWDVIVPATAKGR